jgi:choline dehydrogenase-like flavoprotein
VLLDAREFQQDAEFTTTVCIVGARPAGITLARVLNGAGCPVVLLEAGGERLEADTQALYAGQSVGLPYYPLELSRLRYLGGTTNHWTGWCRPLDPIDFERRAWVPDSGWPLSRAELEPYYAKAQVVVGSSGPLTTRPRAGRRARVRRSFRSIRRSRPRSSGSSARRPSSGSATARIWRARVTSGPSCTRTGRSGDVRERGASHDRARRDARGPAHHRAPAGAGAGARRDRERPPPARRGEGHPGGLGNRHDVVGRYFMEHPHANRGWS